MLSRDDKDKRDCGCDCGCDCVNGSDESDNRESDNNNDGDSIVEVNHSKFPVSNPNEHIRVPAMAPAFTPNVIISPMVLIFFVLKDMVGWLIG